MKKCPFCAEEIKEEAVKCKHCGEWMNSDLISDELKVGCRLRRLRQQRNMTLRKLSELSGIQSATLSRIENNKMTGNIKNYIGIARAFGLRLSDLFLRIEL